jgi:hypothetical protein
VTTIADGLKVPSPESTTLSMKQVRHRATFTCSPFAGTQEAIARYSQTELFSYKKQLSRPSYFRSRTSENHQQRKDPQSRPRAQMTSPTKTPYGENPEPYICPSKLEHKQTFIILHGRGSSANEFAPPLLATRTPLGETLKNAFPHAKLIFLCSPTTTSVKYNGDLTPQWFGFPIFLLWDLRT